MKRLTTLAATIILGMVAATTTYAAPLKLTVNDTQELRFEKPVDLASVVDTEVADIIIRESNPKNVLVQANAPGSTAIVFKTEEGEIIGDYEVRVRRDAESVNKALDTVLPEADIRAKAIEDAVYLRGTVSDPTMAETAKSVALQHIPEDSLQSDMSVNSARQVNLRVRVAEVRRSVSKNLGFDSSYSSPNDKVTYGDGPGGQFDITRFTPAVANAALGNNAVGVAAEVGEASLSTVLDALENKGMVRTLAEPNLTALSGETAEMLAGGEIPVPIPQGDGGVGIEYREFGVGLNFKPVIKENDRISLKIETEVSTLDGANGVTIGGTNVPAIAKRSASTRVEIPSGGAIAIAGLLRDDIESRLRGTTWAQDIPVLGNLFSSSSFQADRTELVVSVTPYLVRPTDPDQLSDPAQTIAPPSDVDLFLHRELSEEYADGREPPAAARKSLGYMLDREADSGGK